MEVREGSLCLRGIWQCQEVLEMPLHVFLCRYGQRLSKDGTEGGKAASECAVRDANSNDNPLTARICRSQLPSNADEEMGPRWQWAPGLALPVAERETSVQSRWHGFITAWYLLVKATIIIDCRRRCLDGLPLRTAGSCRRRRIL
jgi:hypothetical protein